MSMCPPFHVTCLLFMPCVTNLAYNQWDWVEETRKKGWIPGKYERERCKGMPRRRTIKGGSRDVKSAVCAWPDHGISILDGGV